MPQTLEITGPDGKTYEITPPEGASSEDIRAQLGKLGIGGSSQRPSPAMRAAQNLLNPQPLTQTERSNPLGDFARQELPPLAAMAATAPMAEAGLAARGLTAAATAATTSRALGASPQEAGAQGAVAAGGEAVAPMLGAVINKGRAFVRGLTAKAAQGEVGRQIVNDAAQKVVDATVNRISNTPREIGAEEIRAGFNSFAFEHGNQSIGLLQDAVDKAVTGGKQVNIADINKRIAAAIHNEEVARGGLSPFGQLSADAAKAKTEAEMAGKAVRTAKEYLGTKAPDTPATPGVLPPSDDEIAAKVLEALRSNSSHVAALMNARGQISQLLANGNLEASTRRVLRAVDLGQLDAKIVDGLSPDAAQAWKTYMQFHAAGKQIAETAFFKAAKASPDKIGEFIAPNQPTSVDVIRSVARQTNSPEIVAEAQKQFLRNAVDDAGLQGLKAKIAEYGQPVVAKLFQEPKAAEALATLMKASDSFAEKFGNPGIAGALANERLATLMGRAAVGGTVGAIAGGAGGGRGGAGLGSALGAMAGAGASFYGQRALVNMALKDPGAFRAFTVATQKYLEEGGDARLNYLSKRLAAFMVPERPAAPEGQLVRPDASAPATMRFYEGQ